MLSFVSICFNSVFARESGLDGATVGFVLSYALQVAQQLRCGNVPHFLIHALGSEFVSVDCSRDK